MEPGYKKIRIQPTLTKGMTEVSATYESIYAYGLSQRGSFIRKSTL